MNKPDRWVVVKITKKGTEDVYKVFATWMGGYLGGDAWRMNSGIVSVVDADITLTFIGHSGSEYECPKGSYGFSAYTQGALESLISRVEEDGYVMTIMDKDSDFLNMVFV